MYTPKGGHISITINEKEDMYYFPSLDTGIGIKKKFLVFLNGFIELTEQEVEIQVGLTWALLLLNIYGSSTWRIMIESEVGKGTQFTIAFNKEQKEA
ncbi:hypothetical protein KHA80_16455 [Anaerobacillus sp. HL2]|nr:hypothetical protein KHA80_16455 [Anaerobacillus sp. HL2]